MDAHIHNVAVQGVPCGEARQRREKTSITFKKEFVGSIQYELLVFVYHV